MHRWFFFIAGSLLLSATALAQVPSDSPTLQAILDELRQIRQDLRTTSIAAQRSQLLLYRLQSQEAAVARASQRLDDARARLAEAQAAQKKTAAQIQDYKNWLRDHSENPAEKKNVEDAIAQFQAKLEAQVNEGQQRQSNEIEADQQFRLEQAKLTALQDQLDQLDRDLRASARSPK